MKKILCSFLVLVAVLFFVFMPNTAEAATINHGDKNIQIERFEDGSILEIITEQNQAKNTLLTLFRKNMSHATGSKTLNYRNPNGVLAWTLQVTASFVNNNGSITCSNITTQQNIYDSAWTLSNIRKGSSGNTAWASVTGTKRYLGSIDKQITKKVTLTCSSNGKIY